MRSIIKLIAAALRASLTGPGLLGWFVALTKPIAKILSMAGDVDLLANYFGVAGRFLETGWGTLTSVVLGAVIIGYAIHRKMQLKPTGLGDKAPVKHEDSELVQAKSAIPANPVRDVGVDDAIAFLCFRDWGKRFLDAAGSGKFGSEYDMFLQAAADGLVPIWGKRENWDVHQPIPRDYWYHNRIDWFSLLKGDAKSESSTQTFQGGRYLSLMTSKAAVEALGLIRKVNR